VKTSKQLLSITINARFDIIWDTIWNNFSQY